MGLWRCLGGSPQISISCVEDNSSLVAHSLVLGWECHVVAAVPLCEVGAGVARARVLGAFEFKHGDGKDHALGKGFISEALAAGPLHDVVGILVEIAGHEFSQLFSGESEEG